MTNIETINLKGNDYALVPERLKAFRELNPRAKIKTTPMPSNDGSMIFQAYILTDKADATSAEATGSARASANEMKQPKAFEKLETVAVGRALSLLGYLNNGQVASTEEMIEFESYKEEKGQQELAEAEHAMRAAQSIDELKQVYVKLAPAIRQQLIPLKNERKAQFTKGELDESS